MADAYPTFKYTSPCDVCGREAVWLAHVAAPDECLSCPHDPEEYR